MSTGVLRKRSKKGSIPSPSPEALARNPNMRLGDPEMAATLRSLRERVASDPAFARQLLANAGIVTPGGKLKKSFGGGA